MSGLGDLSVGLVTNETEQMYISRAIYEIYRFMYIPSGEPGK